MKGMSRRERTKRERRFGVLVKNNLLGFLGMLNNF
jgi:hypothetical protein